MILGSVILGLLLFFNLAALWDFWNDQYHGSAKSFLTQHHQALGASGMSGILVLGTILGLLPDWNIWPAWGCAALGFALVVRGVPPAEVEKRRNKDPE